MNFQNGGFHQKNPDSWGYPWLSQLGYYGCSHWCGMIQVLTPFKVEILALDPLGSWDLSRRRATAAFDYVDHVVLLASWYQETSRNWDRYGWKAPMKNGEQVWKSVKIMAWSLTRAAGERHGRYSGAGQVAESTTSGTLRQIRGRWHHAVLGSISL